jgi:DNA (cytosine-5)-methyltransferase 1
MPRPCPPHLDPQCFANIVGDGLSSDGLKDEIILALERVGSQADAKRTYAEWRTSVLLAGRHTSSAKTFSAGERVGRLRFRPRYLSELADRLRSSTGLGIDETDVEGLVSWMAGQPSTMEDAAARFLFVRFLVNEQIESQSGWYFRRPSHSPQPFVPFPNCLPWQLGLWLVSSGTEYVGFDVDPTHLQNPRAPVFVDATWDTRNGNAKNRDQRNGLIREMIRFARAFRPKAVMMENVPALAEHSSFRRLCNDLRDLGYRVEWAIKDAQYFGVPQRRRRLILVAGRGFDIPLAKESRALRTVRNAFANLREPGSSRDALQNIRARRSEKVLDIIKAIPKDGGSRNDLPNSKRLACHKRTDGFWDTYGRMAWDRPSPTITSGCSNPSKGRFLHPWENRAITLREAAILQSFPRRYKFPLDANKDLVALMIGNALPPIFVQRHAEMITRSMARLART